MLGGPLIELYNVGYINHQKKIMTNTPIHNVKPIPEFVQRVIVEHEELKEKRVKLVAFIETPQFDVLPIQHCNLLIKQKDAMTDYMDVLEQRIALLKSEL